MLAALPGVRRLVSPPAAPLPAPDRIDVHTHLLPRELPRWADRFGYGGFVGLDHRTGCRARMVRDDGTVFREVDANLWDPSERLRDMDHTAVAVQVLSTVPVLFNYWAQPHDTLQVAQHLNDHLAEVVRRRPDRFVGLGTLPMQSPDLAVAELERCVRDLGLHGAQIGSHVRGPNADWNLDEPALFAVFAKAAEIGAAIFVHPWDMMGESSMRKYWLPWLVGMPAECSRALCSLIFGGVLARLPALRICVAHGGGSFAATLGRIQHGFEARPDLCAIDNPLAPRDHVGRFWVDALVHDPLAVRLLLDTFGDDRVAVGSDYPFPLGEARPGALIDVMRLPNATRRKLLRANALDWLGLRDDLSRKEAL